MKRSPKRQPARQSQPPAPASQPAPASPLVNGKQRNILKQRDVFRIAKALDAMWDTVVQNVMTMEQAAESLSLQLGMEVTVSNVRSIFRSTMGQDRIWPGPRSKHLGPAAHEEFLARQLFLLATALDRFFADNGYIHGWRYHGRPDLDALARIFRHHYPTTEN